MNFMMMILMLFMILLTMSSYYLEFLIGMEFLVILLLYLIIYNQMNIWFFLIYMVYSVCEAVLGLSLLVSLNFDYGHQKLMLLNLY